MAPPVPEHFKKFTANPSRPARYRPGKAAQEDESSGEEEEEEETQAIRQSSKSQTRPKPAARPAPAEEDDDDDDEGFVTEEDDEADGGAPIVASASKSTPETAKPPQSSSTLSTAHTTTQRALEHSDEDEDEGDDSESEEESEEESSTEEDTPKRKFQRPTFIKKTERKATDIDAAKEPERQNATPAPPVSTTAHSKDVAARRLQEAEQMIKTTIERDAQARLAGKNSWDDDDDLRNEDLVDDTDGLDPEAEHSAWRLRELHRLKRDREAMIAREKELEEIERRRNLTKEEREAEDRYFIAKQREEKEASRGQAGYLTKYHHKGAFFLDDEANEKLAKRDFAGARFADDVADKSALPEYMRIRDMTKLGKKGRTRYTDLKGQDTGRFGEDVKRWRGNGYQSHRDRDGNATDLRGVDERFLPDDERGTRSNGGPSASGANASVVGPRKDRRRSRSRSVDERDRRKENPDRDANRRRSRSRSRNGYRRRSYTRSRSVSRSRSPRYSRSRSPSHKTRRRRSPSPYTERGKRRRVEA